MRRQELFDALGVLLLILIVFVLLAILIASGDFSEQPEWERF